MMEDILFVAGRILFGGFFVLLGGSYLRNLSRLTLRARLRRIPYPKAVIAACGLLSVAGGLGVILGLRPMLSLMTVSAVLVFTSFRLHDYWNESEPDRIAIEMSQFTKNMALLGAALMMFSILQPWNYSF